MMPNAAKMMVSTYQIVALTLGFMQHLLSTET
jgi:hypothetical protein